MVSGTVEQASFHFLGRRIPARSERLTSGILDKEVRV